MPDGIHLSYAGLGCGTGERVSPRLFSRSVPRVGVRPVEAMPVIMAFDHRTMLDQRSKCPAVQRAVGARVGRVLNLGWVAAIMGVGLESIGGLNIPRWSTVLVVGSVIPATLAR